MHHLHVDPSSGMPAYRQLMDQIRFLASTEVIKPGDQLPSIRSLAKELAVNPSTIVKAYGELDHQGIIELVKGKGAFLATHAPLLSAGERAERLEALTSKFISDAWQLGASAKEIREAIEPLLRRELS